MRTTAALLRPSARAARSRSATAARSRGRTVRPRASTRSGTSITRSYTASGSRMRRSKSRGRFWYAMRRASRNPSVMTRTVGSPRRSSRALVATVVPILTAATRSAGTGSSGASPSSSRIPATAASRWRSGSCERSLRVTSRPSGSLPTTSVNVPPRSIQNSQRPVIPP